MNGEVPPVAFTEADPLLPPEQDTAKAVLVAFTGKGWLTTAVAVAVHPRLSVTVQVNVPAVRPVAVDVV